MDIKIGDRTIGPDHPTYFIADIAANHDGDLERAVPPRVPHGAAEVAPEHPSRLPIRRTRRGGDR